MRRRGMAMAAAAATAVLSTAMVGLGGASSALAGPAPAADHSCVASLVAVPRGARVAPAPQQVRCFGTFAAAIGFATGGRVHLDPAATRVSAAELAAGAVPTSAAPAGATPDLRATASPASSGPVIGIEYTGSYYTGSSLVLVAASGSGCTGSTTYGFPRLADYGFNNVINSAQTYAYCWADHYDGTYYTGSEILVAGAKADFGSMDNRTSSILFW